jgi:hypothetical protein
MKKSKRKLKIHGEPEAPPPAPEPTLPLVRQWAATSRVVDLPDDPSAPEPVPEPKRARSPRVENDFYPTPGWCVRRLLEAFDPLSEWVASEQAQPTPPLRWLEPGVGDGAIVRAVNEFYIERDGGVSIEWQGWPGLFCVSDLDAPDLPARLGGPFSVAIGNPPYNKAAAFIDFARKHAETVVMLLRLNFLGSDKRAAFMRQYPPDVYVLPNRPSFVNEGRTDSTEYAWFVWPPWLRERGRLQVLAQTPDEERKR